jgi:hypothetical protein
LRLILYHFNAIGGNHAALLRCSRCACVIAVREGLGGLYEMSDQFDSTQASSAVRKPQWRTPVLSVDSISDSTRHLFSSGIDRYERTAPHYGQS